MMSCFSRPLSVLVFVAACLVILSHTAIFAQAYVHGTVPINNTVPVQPAVSVGSGYVPMFPPNFPLSPEHEATVDRFLTAWEQYSGKVKVFETPLECKVYDAAEFESQPNVDPTIPTRTATGTFRFVEPNRFRFEIDGTQPEKFVCDGKSFFYFNFDTKKVIEYPIPPDQQQAGTMLGPLPFVFGAKAQEMKDRYFVRIITPVPEQGKTVWLEIWPKWSTDAAEFRSIQFILDASTFLPKALQKFRVNDKSREVYIFTKPQVSGQVPNELAAKIVAIFKPTVPLGWSHEVDRSLMEAAAAQNTAAPNTAAPNTTVPNMTAVRPTTPTMGTGQPAAGPQTGPMTPQPQPYPQPYPQSTGGRVELYRP